MIQNWEEFMAFRYLINIFRIERLHAFGTNAMAEFDLAVTADIRFHLIPVTMVVADSFAAGTDGHNPAQGLDLVKRQLQLVNFGGQRSLHFEHALTNLDAGTKFTEVEWFEKIVDGVQFLIDGVFLGNHSQKPSLIILSAVKSLTVQSDFDACGGQ